MEIVYIPFLYSRLKEIKLFEGNRHPLVVVGLQSEVVEATVDVFGEGLNENSLNRDTAGNFHFIQAAKKNELDGETVSDFREVSTAVQENYSKSSG